VFPAFKKLSETLTNMIVQKSTPLTGPEIKYLRKAARKKASDFAQMIGVSAEQVSRWENGHNPPEKSTDKLIRLLVADRTDSRALDTIANLSLGAPGKESYLLCFQQNKWSGLFGN
jgi:DNA-binding transcriptional regulator YiaG